MSAANFRLPRRLGAALLLATSGCDVPRAEPAHWQDAWVVGGVLVARVGDSDLVAIDPASGTPKWRHQYRTVSGVPHLTRRAPQLSCAPQATDTGRMILRYRDSIQALVLETGELAWQRNCSPELCPDRCTATFADGRVAVIMGRGHAVELLDDAGQPLWTVRLEDGPATHLVAAPGGETVVRTARRLIALGREGRVAWTAESNPLRAVARPTGSAPVEPVPRR